MKQGLQFDFEWLASSPIDASERVDLAELSISVNGKLATELEDKAAEIAGLSRSAFISALSRYRVTPFQYTEAELIDELRDAD